ncbi:hypothetical protein NIES25_13190 [Nostoc linckia NIES-25]|nr:hypothetical protein NIES25_13190 [Nostoc linckia NIES-25]
MFPVKNIDYNGDVCRSNRKKILIPHNNFVIKIFIFIKTLKNTIRIWRQIYCYLIKYDHSISEQCLFIHILDKLTARLLMIKK